MGEGINLGLIGGGYWGKNLIRDFYNLGVLKIVCDLDVEALSSYRGKYPGLKTTTQWEDIVNNEDITCVCISLPASMHYKFAKSALLANKDVYIEKPITLNIGEAKKLIDLAEEKDRILMVGHILHYHPVIEKVKELIQSDRIGKIRSITSNRLNLGKFRTEENVLWSFAPHDVSVILSLVKNRVPDSVSSFGKDFLTEGVHDIVNTVMTYDEERIYVNMNVSWINPTKEQKLTIVGESGMIVFDDTSQAEKLKVYEQFIKSDDGANTPVAIKDEGDVVDVDLTASPLVNECSHFIECCRTRTKPITDGEEGYRVLEVLSACQKSLDTDGKVVRLREKFFAHETATIDSGANIGDGTKIWHYSHVSSGSKIGEKCNIGQNVFIASKTVIGNNCKIQNNVSIYSGVVCEDHVFFGPSCVLTNDINPRAEFSKNGEYIKTYIERGATIGANATIVCGNKIGHHSLVGAGAVVTKDVKPYSIVVGNPAKPIGKIDEYGDRVLD